MRFGCVLGYSVLIAACGSTASSGDQTAAAPPATPVAAPTQSQSPATSSPPAAASASATPSPIARTAVATRSGHTITITPPGLSFDVPDDWVRWYASSHNNFHLTRTELDAVRDGSGEWDAEYGGVVNAVLPFEGCVVHAGGEGWGPASVAFSDVQMRVYLLADEPDAVEARFRDVAKTTLAGFPSANDPHEDRDDSGAWRRVSVTAMLMFGDYGGEATVDMRLERRGTTTLAFVFMYSNYQSQEPVIQAILGSVR